MDSEYDDAAIEALLGRDGGDADPAVARLVDGIVRSYCTAPLIVGSELAELMSDRTPAPNTEPRRGGRFRASWLAKAAAALSGAIALTGGLAVAHALPAPVQDAVSRLGIGRPASRHAAQRRASDAGPAVQTPARAGCERSRDIGFDGRAGSGGRADGERCRDRHKADRGNAR